MFLLKESQNITIHLVIHKNTFGSVSRDIEFIVPAEAYSAYASHEYWKVFMGGEEITFDEHITDKLNNICYNSQGKILYFNVDSPRVVVVYDTMGRIIMKEVVDATTQQLFLDLNRPFILCVHSLSL